MMDTTKQVLACLIEDGGSLTPEQIAEVLKLPVGDVEDALLTLQVRKRVKRHDPEDGGESSYRTMVRKDARPPVIASVVTKAPEPCTDAPAPRPKPPRPLQEPVHCKVPGCNFIGKNQQGINVHMTRMHGKDVMSKDHACSEASIEDAADRPGLDAGQEDLSDEDARVSIEINADQADRQEEDDKHQHTDMDRIIQAFQVLRSIDPGATARVVVPLQDGTRVMLTLCREED